jgi:hypothetical protein
MKWKATEEGKEMKLMLVEQTTKGQAHCPICTHTVPADITIKGKYPRVAPGQKCPRCQSSLDVAVVVEVPEAA